MGWRTPYDQQLLAATRPWCCLINMDVRIEKVFLWTMERAELRKHKRVQDRFYN